MGRPGSISATHIITSIEVGRLLSDRSRSTRANYHALPWSNGISHFLVYPTEQISKTYKLCSSGWVRFVVFCYHDTSTVYFVNTKVCFLGINYHSLLLEVLKQA